MVDDFSVDEQLYLYEQTRRLKQALLSGDAETRDTFAAIQPDTGCYLFFMEDSTRTKESFRNAAQFHGFRLNDFSSSGSSFNKKESITDTFQMLVGYSRQSIFIVRTKLEGTCRWLEEALGHYSKKVGIPPAVLINAGDGRHEHPTQELLDEFTFLEHNRFDRSHIHLALVGDLYHGRTVHSKADGLGVFSSVRVDLIAPPELEMPESYVTRMNAKGYEVRLFPTIDAYLANGDTATIWYFTRLQLERMGEKLLDRATELREAVTFRREQLARLKTGTKFFHPLPRHQVTPVIPTFLDDLPVNGWGEQSMNGYYTRIVELALLSGHIGSDFAGQPRVKQTFDDDFVRRVQPGPATRKPDHKIGIKPVQDGIVIDHIGRGRTPSEIWSQIDKIRRILDLNVTGSHGVFTGAEGDYKGLISLPGRLEIDEAHMKMLGASAPGCTLNHVRGATVVEKFRMEMPPRVYNLPGISCKNGDCISHPAHHEPVEPEFLRASATVYRCKYCDHLHEFNELW
ncbi:MAG: aspartate carbamoyltransferase [Spirochaetota bacterium]